MSPEVLFEDSEKMSAKGALDVLVFSPHADDAEFFCGGTIAKLAREGARVAIADVTKVTYATRGDHALRVKEAIAAAKVLGLSVRLNLGLRELFEAEGEAERSAVVGVLRELRPRVVLYPYREERHPDHPSTHRLVQQALFLAGLSKYPSLSDDPNKFAAALPLMYEMRMEMDFTFLVDISETFEIKMKAAACYESQLMSNAGSDSKFGAPSYLSNPKAYHALSSRTAYYGTMLGTTHAEPFRTKNVLGFRSLGAFFSGEICDVESFVFPMRRGA